MAGGEVRILVLPMAPVNHASKRIDDVSPTIETGSRDEQRSHGVSTCRTPKQFWMAKVPTSTFVTVASGSGDAYSSTDSMQQGFPCAT
jgi:hypothetical protein